MSTLKGIRIGKHLEVRNDRRALVAFLMRIFGSVILKLPHPPHAGSNLPQPKPVAYKKPVHIIALTLITLLTFQPAFALPTGWQVLSGDVDFHQDGSTLNIISQSQHAVIQYITFNLASGETVNFILPNSSASILNQVLGGQISNISGVINSNGIIALSNTAGVQLANSAQINAASLLLSGLNITGFNENLITLNKSTDNQSGAVINSGKIDIASGGYAILAGGGVINSGNVFAEDGSIHLAVGDSISVHLSDNTIVNVSIDEGIKGLIDDLNVAIGNNGALVAHQVELKTKLDESVFANAVNNDGIIVVSAMTTVGGKIVIEADGGQNIVANNALLYAGATNNSNVAGTIHIKGATAYNRGDIIANGGAGEKGGTVEMLGDVVINEGALIDVSGDVGGGTILVGGDYQGTGDTYRAALNIADESTLILADAITEGDGGKIIFWSDEDTYFDASIYARSGELNGKGGFAEVSGKEYLSFNGFADLTASDGTKGTLLLDPTNITIQTFDPLDLNPTLWLDGSDASTITLSGGRISRWDDKSGNNRDATQGTANNRPVYQTNVQGGNNALYFDGSNDFLQVTGFNPGNGNNARTLYLVMFNGVDTGSAYQDILHYGSEGTNSGFGLAFDYNSGNRLSLDYWSSNFNTTTVNNGNPYIFQGSYGSNTRSYFVNGVGATQNGSLNTGNGGNFYIGSEIGGDQSYYRGNIGEIYTFNKVLSNDERALLEQYEFAKWGFNVSNTTLNNLYLSQTNTVLNTQFLQSLSQTSDINLQATNDINIADLTRNGNTLALGGNASLTLNAGRDIIFNNTNDTIRTEGGDINFIAGRNMTLGTLDTRGASGTLNGGNVILNATGSGNIVMAGGNIGGNLNATNNTGDITINNTAVRGTTLMRTNSTSANGLIVGTGNTFTGVSTFDARDRSGGHITMSADFQGAADFSGDRMIITDTTGDMTISGFSTGTNNSTSTITVNNGTLTIGGISLDSGSATAAGRLDISARNNINLDGTGWNTANDILNAHSTNGGDINVNNLTSTTASALTTTVGNTNPNSNSAGFNFRTNGGDFSILNSRVDGAVNVSTNNADITFGSTGNAVDFNNTTTFSAGNGDVTGYGAYAGNVSGTSGRIGFYANSGNFTANGLTASNATGWYGVSDEGLAIQTQSGDILGTGFTTTGAANIRLQAGSTSSVLATNNIDVTNVNSGQNLSLWATGDTNGNGTGTAIQILNSRVNGYIQAAGFNNSNYLTGANGAITLGINSGNLTTGLVWTNNDNIVLYNTAGNILQSSAGYPWAFNGKTVFTNGGDVYLVAAGGANSYINTGVNAIGAGSDLFVYASGSSNGGATGTSAQLYGRVDGNVDVRNTSMGNTTGRVYLGTGLGASVTDLDDTYTVQDVLGTTTVLANGDVYLYGSFKGAIDITGRSLTAAVDKGNLNFSQVTTSATSGTGINAISYRGSILGGNIQTLGSASAILNAGTYWDRDKYSIVSLTNANIGGNVSIKVSGSTTGNQSGSSVSITGSTGGSTTVTDEAGGAPLGSVNTP